MIKSEVKSKVIEFIESVLDGQAFKTYEISNKHSLNKGSVNNCLLNLEIKGVIYKIKGANNGVNWYRRFKSNQQGMFERFCYSPRVIQ